MRWLASLTATLVTLLLGSAAAQAATAPPTYVTSPSTYFASWSLTPLPAGRPAHPAQLTAVRATFDVETAPPGERPDITQTYDLFFGGVHQNSRYFAHCSPRTVLRAGQGACARARVGNGIMDLLAGDTGDPSSATPCRLALNLYNGAANRLVLVVAGGPDLIVNGADGPMSCPLPFSGLPIDARWVNDAIGSHVRFRMPRALQHPDQGLDASLIHLDAQLRSPTVRAGARRLRIAESFLCPRGHRLQFAATVIGTADRTRTTARAFAPCR
jgi:hypothetical protein